MKSKLRIRMMLVCLCIAAVSALTLAACGGSGADCKDGHTYGDPVWTWTESGDGYTASATFTCTANGKHTETVSATVTAGESTAATCYGEGKTEYSASVTFGGTTYYDSKDKVIAKTSHTYNNVWSKDADGHWKTCTVCGEASEKAAHVSAGAATEYREEVCADCNYEIAPAVTHVHSYGAPQFNWEPLESGYAVKITVTCTDPTHSNVLDATVTSTTVPATCESAGKTTYTATSGSYSDTKVVTIPRLSHDYKLKTSADPDCVTQGTNTYKCDNCTSGYTDTLSPLGHDWDYEEATCEHGMECSRCDASVAALNHDYAPTVTQTLDCEHDRIVEYECANCHDSYEAIDAYATGHHFVSVARSEDSIWTYDSSLDEQIGTSCKWTISYRAHCDNNNCSSAGGEVIRTEEVWRHNYVGSVTTAATCQTAGEKTFTCAACNDSYTQPYTNENAHDFDITENGNVTTYTCKVAGCDHTKKVVAAQGNSANVSKSDLDEANGVKLDNATIELDEHLKNNIGEEVEISAETRDKNSLGLDSDKLEQIGDSPVYDFSMSENGEPMDFGAGKVTVTIPYELQDGEDPENIAIWYINDAGEVEAYPATYANGYLTFETTHFSYYTVTRLTPAERCAVYGHNDDSIVKQNTCVTDGYTLIICKRCGRAEKTEHKDATGHDFDVTETPASCTQSGIKAYVCNNCDYGYTQVTPPLGHNWSVSDNLAATCTHAGYNEYTCSNDCGASYKTTIAQKKHAYLSKVVAPTCTEEGYTEYECSECGDEYVGAYRAATGHSYLVSVVRPSCTTDGYTLHKCKSCDESYRTDIVKATHTWDIEHATCGKGQICVDCGIRGERATGEHTMVNGICSVCGTGCEHKSATSAVHKPTCTEIGYTLTVCPDCGVESKSNFVPATGHSGKLSCTVCGESFAGKNFFANMFAEAIGSTPTFVINDLHITLGDEEEMIAISFAELNVGVDANGNYYGYGRASIFSPSDYYPVPPTIEVSAVIRDETLYAKVDMTGLSEIMGFGRIIFSTQEQCTYMSVPLTGGTVSGEDMSATAMLGAFKWLSRDLSEAASDFVNAYGDGANRILEGLVERYADFATTSDGYVITVDGESLSSLLSVLKEGSVSELFDAVFGDGAYVGFTDGVCSLLDSTIGEIIEKTDAKGFDFTELLGAGGAFMSMMSGGEMDDICPMLGLGELSELRTNEEALSVKLSDAINNLMSAIFGGEGEPDVPSYDEPKVRGAEEESGITAEYVSAMLGDVGNMNVFGLLARAVGMDTDDFDAVFTSNIMPMLSTLRITLTANSEGTLTQAVISLDGEALRFNITADYDYRTTYDYLSLATEVESVLGGITMTEQFFGGEYEKAGYETTYGANGKIESVSFVSDGGSREISIDDRRFSEYLKVNGLDSHHIMEQISKYYEEIGDELRVEFIITDSETYSVEFPENYTLQYTVDCGNWVLIQVNAAVSYMRNSDAVLTLYGVGGEELMCERGRGYNSNGYSGNGYEFLYNTVSGKVKLLPRDTSSSEDATTKHNFVEDESKATEPTGCTGYGKRYFNCTDCGKSYVSYYTNGHGNVTQEYEWTSDVHDCNTGYRVREICTECGEVAATYTSYGHVYNIEEPLDLASYGFCARHRVVARKCFCGKRSELYVENIDSFGGDREGNHTYACEDCGLVIEVKVTVVVGEDCYKTRTYTTIVYRNYENKSVLKTYTRTEEGISHDMIQDVELLGENCTDGVRVTYKCADCGRVEHTEICYDHIYTQEIIDLTEYGAKQGYIVKSGCACGENFGGFRREGNYEESWDYDAEDRHNYTLYVSLEGDGFAFRVGYRMEKDENCYVTEYTVLQFGYDQKNYTYKSSMEIKAWSQGQRHRPVTGNITLKPGAENCNDGVLVTYVCADCGMTLEQSEQTGHMSKVVEDIDLAPYGAVCGEHLHIRECPCGEIRQYEVVLPEGSSWAIDEVEGYYGENVQTRIFVCAVTDPVPCGLIYGERREYTPGEVGRDGTERITVLLGCDREGNNARREVFIGESKQHMYVAYGEEISLGHCEYRQNQRCAWCGDVITGGIFSRHDYGERGDECTLYTRHVCRNCGDVWLEHPGHSWMWVDGAHIYVCMRCGIENINGADGEIVLEDRTAQMGDGDNIYVAYAIRNGDPDMQEIDKEQWLLSVWLVFESGEMIPCDDVEVHTYYNHRDGHNYVYVSKSEIAQAAGGYENYDVRIQFIRAGGWGDTDYAITVTDPEKAAQRLAQQKAELLDFMASEWNALENENFNTEPYLDEYNSYVVMVNDANVPYMFNQIREAFVNFIFEIRMNAPDCNHEMGGDYYSDINGHFHACIYCGMQMDFESHSYENNGDGNVCTVCNYRECPHENMGYAGNEQGHFNICTACGSPFGFEPHTYVEQDGKQVCSVCQYQQGEHEHNFTYKDKDDSVHFLYCITCGEQREESQHKYDGGKCVDCGHCCSHIDGNTGYDANVCVHCGQTLNNGWGA